MSVHDFSRRRVSNKGWRVCLSAERDIWGGREDQEKCAARNVSSRISRDDSSRCRRMDTQSV